MEYFPTRISALAQLFAEPIPDVWTGGWESWDAHNHPIQRTEVICPQPRRAVKVPYVVDNLQRYSGKTKSLNVHRGDDGLDILEIIFNKGDLYNDLETSGQGGFFCGSPPVRSSNPLIHDKEFVKQSLSVASPLGNFNGTKRSPRMERAISCGSSYSGSPKIRIEGFASGNSESRSVVSARA